MKEITAKMKQYRNLILVLAVAIALVVLIASDPLGFCAQRVHDRAAIYNQMAIEKAEADKQIAIIQAQTDAELKRIAEGAEVTEQETVELDTPAEASE